ncbi:MAG TPA: terminase [Terriglobales bacterium]|jgi:hypothetical protein
MRIGRAALAAGSELDIPPTLRDQLIAGLLMIRSKKRGLVPLQLNRAQLEFSRAYSTRNIVLKARQLGITTYVAARFFIETIVRPGTLTVQVAHNQDSAEDIFRIVHRFWENLPEATRTGALVTSHNNVRQIAFPSLDSEYRIATAGDPNAGRGVTIHNLHCSEVARWLGNGEEVLASLREAVPAEGQVVLESTPNGAGGTFYDEWQRADETSYTRHFFPWWYDDQYSSVLVSTLGTLTDEEVDLVRKFGLNEGQIAWRRTKHSEMRDLAAQEYAEDPVSCFRVSGECVFDLTVIDEIAAAGGEPLETDENKRLMIWLPQQGGKEYIIGVDPAGGGTGGDYSCAEIIDRQTGMQCAELRGHFPLRDLALKLIALSKRYNDALVVVERNNHGHGVLAHLREQNFSHIYSEKGRDGWLTSAVSRPSMIENLAASLVSEPLLFHSSRLLQECRTFVRHADGSSGAISGAYDDCVMAMAIALAARRDIAGDTKQSRKLEVASVSRGG